jgi:hypothetical protein
MACDVEAAARAVRASRAGEPCGDHEPRDEHGDCGGPPGGCDLPYAAAFCTM